MALHREPSKQGGGQPKPEAGFVCSGGFSWYKVLDLEGAREGPAALSHYYCSMAASLTWT